MLCILYLLNNKEFEFSKNEYGRTKIFFEKEIYKDLDDIRTENIDFKKVGDTFSNLAIIGNIELNWNDTQSYPYYTFLVTNLKADKWCTETLLQSLNYGLNLDPYPDSHTKLTQLYAEIKECVIDGDFKLASYS